MGIGDSSRLALYVREDVRDTVRQRQAQVIVGLYALVGAWVANNAASSSLVEPHEVDLFAELVPVLALLTPLVALGFFCSSLVQKRTGGALTVILGLPFSRKTVVLGTLIGRCLVMTAAVLAAIAAAVPVGYLRGITFEPINLLGAVLLVVLLGVTFTAFAVFLSVVTRTATRATVAAFGTFVIFAANVWSQLPRLGVYISYGLSYPDTYPAWYDFVVALNPMAAYTYLVAEAFPDLEGGTFIQAPQEPAFYERPTFAAAVLLGWIVFATWFGYRRFRATDL